MNFIGYGMPNFTYYENMMEIFRLSMNLAERNALKV